MTPPNVVGVGASLGSFRVAVYQWFHWQVRFAAAMIRQPEPAVDLQGSAFRATADSGSDLAR